MKTLYKLESLFPKAATCFKLELIEPQGKRQLLSLTGGGGAGCFCGDQMRLNTTSVGFRDLLGMPPNPALTF